MKCFHAREIQSKKQNFSSGKKNLLAKKFILIFHQANDSQFYIERYLGVGNITKLCIEKE